MPRGWAACKCFYRRNFYVKQLDEHLEYLGDEQFLFQYQKYFNKCDGRTILEDVKTELARRKNRFAECEENRKNILERFQLSLEIKSAAVTNIIERSQPTEIIDNIFRLPVFEPSFCDQIMEEIGKEDLISPSSSPSGLVTGRFKSCGLPHSRVSSMSKHGVLATEIGLDTLVDQILPAVETLARCEHSSSIHIFLDLLNMFLLAGGCTPAVLGRLRAWTRTRRTRWSTTRWRRATCGTRGRTSTTPRSRSTSRSRTSTRAGSSTSSGGRRSQLATSVILLRPNAMMH